MEMKTMIQIATLMDTEVKFERDRIFTHIGFGGHYQLRNHLKPVMAESEEQIPDENEKDDMDNDDELDGELDGANSNISISEHVADFETDRLIEQTLAKFPKAKQRAKDAFISKRFFSDQQQDNSMNQDPNFGRRDHYPQALSSLLKVCVEHNDVDQFVPELRDATDPSLVKAVNKLRFLSIQQRIEERRGVIRGFVPELPIELMEEMPIEDYANSKQKKSFDEMVAMAAKKVEEKNDKREKKMSKLRSPNQHKAVSSDAMTAAAPPKIPAASRKLQSPLAAKRAVKFEVTAPNLVPTLDMTDAEVHKNTIMINFVKEMVDLANSPRNKAAGAVVDNSTTTKQQTEVELAPNSPSTTPMPDDGSGELEEDSVSEQDNVTEARTQLKELQETVMTAKRENRPLTRRLKKALNIRHEDMNVIMKELLDESCNRLSDDKRVNLEESVLIVNGFNLLDSDSDGFLSPTDLETFFKKRKCVPDYAAIESTMWMLDDCRNGFLTLDNVKSYYFRVLEHYSHWTPLAALDQHYLVVMQARTPPQKTIEKIAMASAPVSNKKSTPLVFPKVSTVDSQKAVSASERKRPRSAKKKVFSEDEKLKFSLSLVRKAAEGMTESLFLYRLLMFAALENNQKKVHLLSALEQMVERFGPDLADIKFEQLFCKCPLNLLDSELHDLSSFLQIVKDWDKKYEEFKTPISPRERGSIYTHCRYQGAAARSQQAKPSS